MVIGVVLDDPGWLVLSPRVQIWVSMVGFSWVANPMVALAKLYLHLNSFSEIWVLDE